MRSVALVFAGGALGSLARYLLSLALPGLWPVFVVNTVGSFLLGLLLGWFGPHGPDDTLRLLLGTGFLGGFTTYSALALDVAEVGLAGGPVLGLAVAVGSAALGFLAALLGFAVAGNRREMSA